MSPKTSMKQTQTPLTNSMFSSSILCVLTELWLNASCIHFIHTSLMWTANVQNNGTQPLLSVRHGDCIETLRQIAHPKRMQTNGAAMKFKEWNFPHCNIHLDWDRTASLAHKNTRNILFQSNTRILFWPWYSRKKIVSLMGRLSLMLNYTWC